MSVIVYLACPAGCQTCVLNANGGTTCTSGGCISTGYVQIASTSCVG